MTASGKSAKARQKPNQRLSISFQTFLDVSRALAATLVLVVHLRDPLFLGWPSLGEGERNIFVRGWFFVAGMGFESVVVFFVLSGFLVGGLGWGKVKAGSFSLSSYAIDRVSRLFVVFIPALLLTVLLDRLGAHWFGDLGYWTGSNPVLAPKFPSFETRSQLGTFWCNLAMLQSFYCPAYGSNIPLWSLSYEFWFYVVFGLSVLLMAARGWARIAAAVAVVAVLILLGVNFLLLLVAWLFGVAAYLWQPKALQQPMLSAIAFVGLTCLSRVIQGPEFGAAVLQSSVTMLQAAAFAWLLLSMRHVESPLLERFSGVGKHLASFSYTLYLIHFPLMLFVLGVMARLIGRNAFMSGFSPASLEGVGVYLAAFLIVMALAWLFSRATEAHTHKIRSWLKRKLVAAN
jgi:peptidoglycan/LPS O-acetylase OafA/YrhL